MFSILMEELKMEVFKKNKKKDVINRITGNAELH